ncbi:hypothetical protein ABC395_08940 [Paenibacillus sp. 1P03SA]
MATIKAVAVVEGVKVDGGAPIFYAKDETELQQSRFQSGENSGCQRSRFKTGNVHSSRP